MKTIIILLLLFGMSTVHAQKVIQLDAANLEYSPEKLVAGSEGSELYLLVKENYRNEFISNPIRFMENNFDLSMVDIGDFEEVEVKFLSTKGYLKATFNNDGKLLRTYQHFEDIVLPLAVRTQLFSENLGWTMVSNKYIAKGKENRINKELYKIKMENGKQSKRVTIEPVIEAGGRVAGN